MPKGKIVEMVEGTADPAFAIDASGRISAWNVAAEELFGLTSAGARGRACHEILQGTDEGGVVYSEHYAIEQAIETNRPLANFDLQVQTAMGKRRWCNISAVIVTDPRSGKRHALCIMRPLKRKRLERLVRDFVASETELEREMQEPSTSSTRTGSLNAKLTPRENEILQMLASGIRTNTIAKHLYISPATVKNHIKHILIKFDAHSRYEAIQRAERAGLI